MTATVYSPSLDNPGVVIQNLSAIDTDLAERQNDLEKASGAVAENKRDLEYQYALAFAKTTGTVDERKQATVSLLWRVDDGLFMQEIKRAEAELAAVKAVVDVLETRASINQSVLKRHTRESFGAVR